MHRDQVITHKQSLPTGKFQMTSQFTTLDTISWLLITDQLYLGER